MGHEFSKRLLARASTFELRQKAVRAALGLGMSLLEIEEYLDWLDNHAPRDAEPVDEPEQEVRRSVSPFIPAPHADQQDVKNSE